MNPWFYIIVGGFFVVLGGIMASYGWHILPKSKPSESGQQITAQQEIHFPLVDLELKRPETGFTYDIFIHNKSNGPLSNIAITRVIIPTKNRQKIAVYSSSQSKLKSFRKQINVLGVSENKKFYREHSPSYEYTKLTVTYQDGSGKRYKCDFEGDRDGLYLKNKSSIGNTNSKE